MRSQFIGARPALLASANRPHLQLPAGSLHPQLQVGGLFCQSRSKRRSSWCCWGLRLTIHSSRTCFAPSKGWHKKACHPFASTTQVGLIQVLGRVASHKVYIAKSQQHDNPPCPSLGTQPAAYSSSSRLKARRLCLFTPTFEFPSFMRQAFCSSTGAMSSAGAAFCFCAGALVLVRPSDLLHP